MKLEIEITRADFVDFNIHHFLKNQLVSTLITALGLLVILFVMLSKADIILDFAVLFGTSFTFLFFYFLIIYAQLQRTGRIPAENGSTLGVKELDFLEDAIQYKDKHSNSEHSWAVIKFISESKKCFFLYLDRHAAIIIPKRYFASEEHAREFRMYIEGKIKSS